MTAATSSGITTAGATTITYDNIVDLVHSVDPAYRAGARFMFNDTVLASIRKLKRLAAVDGAELWPNHDMAFFRSRKSFPACYE